MTSPEILFGVVFSTVVILVLIGSVVLVIALATRQRNRQEKALVEVQLQYQKELRTIEAEVQEATLSHLAAELHDNIGQLLTVMNLQIEKQKLMLPAMQPLLSPIGDTLQATMQQVRLLSHSLSNDFISDSGLQAAVRQEAHRLQAPGRQIIYFDSDDVEPELPKDARTVAFRIFQEALSNAIRHAAAEHIAIILKGAGSFVLELRDDGIGFDKQAIISGAHGIGLKNILRRARLAGLECSIDTAPGAGCIFIITQRLQIIT